jgi:hypothetical protein
MGNSVSTLISSANEFSQTFHGPVHSSTGTVKPFSNETASPNGFRPLKTEAGNKSNQVPDRLVHVPNELDQSPAHQLSSPHASTQNRTENVDLHHVLRQVEVKQFPFSNQAFCERVWIFRDRYFHIDIVLPNNVLVYVFGKEELGNQVSEASGVIISSSLSIGLAPISFSPILDPIMPSLIPSLGSKLTILVLYGVSITHGLMESLKTSELETIHLHRVSFDNDLGDTSLIEFCKTLKNLHIILDSMVSDGVGFKLPTELKELTAYFDQTDATDNVPVWFYAYGSISLSRM